MKQRALTKIALSAVIIGMALSGCSKGCSRKAPEANVAAVGTEDLRSTQPTNSSDRKLGKDTGTLPTGSEDLVPSKPSAPVQAQVPPLPKEKPCFTVTFKTKSNACMHHRNLLRLEHANVNAKSLCVRVDGTPIRYQAVPQSKNGKGHLALLIGPVSGPQAKVTATFCEDKEKCKETCTVPKDEFMEAIGGDLSDGQVHAKWDPDDAENDNDVSQELDDDIKRELASNGDLATFEGWTASDSAPACRD